MPIRTDKKDQGSRNDDTASRKRYRGAISVYLGDYYIVSFGSVVLPQLPLVC